VSAGADASSDPGYMPRLAPSIEVYAPTDYTAELEARIEGPSTDKNMENGVKTRIEV
jgi:hypothetical protein